LSTDYRIRNAQRGWLEKSVGQKGKKKEGGWRNGVVRTLGERNFLEKTIKKAGHSGS